MKSRHFLIFSAIIFAIVALCLFPFWKDDSINKRMGGRDKAPRQEVVVKFDPPTAKGKWEPLNFDPAKPDFVGVWLYSYDGRKFLFVNTKTGISMTELK